MSLRKPLTRALLRAELAMRLELEAIADRHFDWVAASLEANPAATDGMIAASLARDADWLELEAQAAMVRGRQGARNGAWAIFLPFLEGLGLVGTRRPTDEYDGAKSSFAARGLALSFAAIVQAALAQWRGTGKSPGELAKAIRKQRERMPSAIERTASTENAEAFNHELLTQGVPPDGSARPILWTWDGILDRRICPTCGQLDGQVVPDGQLFELVGVKFWPPTHPRCRCIAIPSAAPHRGSRTGYVGAQVAGDNPSPWHHDDLPRPSGTLTQPKSAPAPKPHEKRIDDYLLAQGNDIEVRAVNRKLQKVAQPDRIIGGREVEYTAINGPKGTTGLGTANSLASRLNNKTLEAQADHLVVDARGHDAIDREATLNVLQHRFIPRGYKQVRIIGDDFDITHVVP